MTVDWNAVACCRLTEVPQVRIGWPDGEPDRGGDTLAGLRAALVPALTGAYAAARAVLVAWVRSAPAGPVRVLLGGDLAGPHPTYPPGSRAEVLPSGSLVRELGGLPAWVRCTGRPDALAETSGVPSASAGGAMLDDLVAHLGGVPFAWLVLAEPVSRSVVREQLTDLQYRIGRRADRQTGSAREQVEWERDVGRYRELSRALATGLWQVHVLAGGADPTGAARTAALLCAATDLVPLPYTLHAGGPPAAGASGSLARVLAGSLSDEDLGSSPFAAPAELLAALARPPVRELPGVRVVEPPRFDVTPEVGAGIPLGVVLDAAGEAAGRFEVPVSTLNRHVFVAGATGAGKSQSVRHLLEGLHAAGIPWLVIEPAKAEYARMAGRLADTGGEVVVIRPGDPDQVAVSLNPLEPEPGFPLQTHLDLVRALFLAAFEANEPFPQVLARALTRCYQDLGWDLTLGEPCPAGGIPRYPTLGDLQRIAAEVVGQVGYGAEMTADVRGFVDVRLGSLRLGAPGRFFDGGHPLDVADLLRRNVVLELEDVGNDQDKAFCIGAVLIRVAEHLRVISRPGPERLRHVTVVEEAHRLLTARAAGTPAAHAVELFAALLAEIRAYGEGVVVAEQIPGKLLPDVVKNTALKVVHRLPAADDRELVGATMNLDAAQSRHVVTLPPGQAAVFADGMDRPVLVRVPLGEQREAVAGDPAVPGVRTSRSRACGPWCRTRPCTLREIVAGRDLAADARLVLWVELLTVAHLAGEVRPWPRAEVSLGEPDRPARAVECAVAQLAQRAVEARYPDLLRYYQPEDLAAHLAETVTGGLRGRGGPCPVGTETRWQAGRYRWVDVGRALTVWRGPRDRQHPDTPRWRDRGLDLAARTVDGQRELLLAHPSRRAGGRRLLYGEGSGALESAVDALGRNVDPVARLAEATAFLDPATVGWLTSRLVSVSQP